MFLSGWKALLLNNVGRCDLVNSVLNNQLIFAMCASLIPPWGGRCCGQASTFLPLVWGDKVTILHCLVSWNKVYSEKSHGGLGVCDLKIQNTYLLLRLVHELHQPLDSPLSSGSNLMSLSSQLVITGDSLRTCFLYTMQSQLFVLVMVVTLPSGLMTSFASAISRTACRPSAAMRLRVCLVGLWL
jgi:hypothetical protein